MTKRMMSVFLSLLFVFTAFLAFPPTALAVGEGFDTARLVTRYSDTDRNYEFNSSASIYEYYYRYDMSNFGGINQITLISQAANADYHVEIFDENRNMLYKSANDASSRRTTGLGEGNRFVRKARLNVPAEMIFVKLISNNPSLEGVSVAFGDTATIGYETFLYTFPSTTSALTSTGTYTNTMTFYPWTNAMPRTLRVSKISLSHYWGTNGTVSLSDAVSVQCEARPISAAWSVCTYSGFLSSASVAGSPLANQAWEYRAKTTSRSFIGKTLRPMIKLYGVFEIGD